MSEIRDAAARLFASAPDAATVRAAGFAGLHASGLSHADIAAVFTEAARAGLGDDAVAALGPPDALNRAALIAGALDAALALTVDHVNARVQFGKALARQQAVQQALAGFACDAALVAAAVQAAAAALDAGLDGRFECLSAKLVANRCVPRGTSVAHQLHGAIGFTADHPLHRRTVALNRWRREGGVDTELEAALGALAAGDLWGMITERGDRSMSA